MARVNGDGSIVLSTQVDTSGLSKGMQSLKKFATVVGIAFSVKQIIQFSNETAKLATQTEASVKRLTSIYGSASTVVGDFIDQNARALGMSKSAAASFASVYGNLFSVWADQKTNAELTNRYLQTTAVIASKTGRTVEDVQERIRSGLLGNTEAIEDLGVFVNVKTIEMTDAFQRMAAGKSWNQLDAYTQQQIRSMAILEQATAKYGDEVENTSATIRNRFNAAYEDFKNSWGTIVNQILLPILKVLTEVFNIATAGLNALFGMGDNILGESEENANVSSETADNIEQQTQNQKELNKEMKKTLAGFDDIQILTSEISDSESGGGESVLPDLPNGKAGNYDPSKKINARVAKIMEIVSLGLVAIGLILLFLGNIGWGIGYIIAGAGLLTVTEAAVGNTSIDYDLMARIQTIMQIVAPSLVAIGLILLFLGLIPWGLGFIVTGAATFAVSELVPTGSSDVKDGCNAILAFLAGLVAYLITKAVLANWGKFVKLWGDFRALTQLMKSEGIANTIKTMFGSSLGTMQLWAIAIGVIVGAIAYLALNWDKLSPAQRTITILGALAAAATTAAIAVALFHTSWSIGIAAAAIAGGIAVLAGTYLFKQKNEKGGSVKNAKGAVPAGISQYSYLADADTYSLPALAKGAVIPPNREFLAVLGDQRQGVNIESPLQTIVDAFNIALDKRGGSGGGNTEVVLEIDGREFGRAVVEQGNRENRRIGTKLVIV